MKKYLSIILMAAMALVCLSACGNKTTNAGEIPSDGVAEDKQLHIVTTIFPEYDWVKEILGDQVSNAEITMLLDNGVDLHSYQPTAEDIMKISNSDLFIYVGGESDEWVEGALQGAVNKDMKVINLMDVLSDTVKAEEAMPGMQAEEDHDHGYSHFADSDVRDRSLSDWAGDWQSVYPFKFYKWRRDTINRRQRNI